jgi:hypothetical protein
LGFGSFIGLLSIELPHRNSANIEDADLQFSEVYRRNLSGNVCFDFALHLRTAERGLLLFATIYRSPKAQFLACGCASSQNQIIKRAV